jgi:hypothetical protein
LNGDTCPPEYVHSAFKIAITRSRDYQITDHGMAVLRVG